MTEEILKKAKTAKSPEELIELAKENGMEDFSEESAKYYFDILNKTGELSDDELSNAAGGCKRGGRTIVTRGTVCLSGYDSSSRWECKVCHGFDHRTTDRKGNICYLDKQCTCGRSRPSDFALHYEGGVCGNFNATQVCGSCDFCTYEGGTWFCNDPFVNSL